MKFAINYKSRQIISMIFILLICTEYSSCMRKKHKLVLTNNNKYFKSMNSTFSNLTIQPKVENNHSNSNNHIHTINPWFSLVLGTFEMIGGKGENNWHKCIPDTWAKEVKNIDNKEIELYNNEYDSWHISMKPIVDFLESIVDKFCYVKDKIVKILKDVLGYGGKSFLQAKTSLSRRYHSHWFTEKFKTFKEHVVDIWEKVKKSANKAWHFISDPIKNILELVKISLISLKNKIVGFFTSSMWEQLKKIYECSLGIGEFQEKIEKNLSDGIHKIQRLGLAAVAGGLPLVIIISDLIVGIICNRGAFKKSYDYFKEGSMKTRIMDKFHFYGKGFGEILFGISSAKTIIKNKKKEKE